MGDLAERILARYKSRLADGVDELTAMEYALVITYKHPSAARFILNGILQPEGWHPDHITPKNLCQHMIITNNVCDTCGYQFKYYGNNKCDVMAECTNPAHYK